MRGPIHGRITTEEKKRTLVSLAAHDKSIVSETPTLLECKGEVEAPFSHTRSGQV